MELHTKYRIIPITEPTLHELTPLASASLHKLWRLHEADLSEGAAVIRRAILSVVNDPLPEGVTKDYLQERKPKSLTGVGSYGVNPATTPGTGAPPMEFLYRSRQVKGQRTRISVGRIKTCAQELADLCGPAASPDDAVGPWLIQASLLLKHAPPGTARRFDPVEAQQTILEFIIAYRDEHGYPPTFTEIAEELNMVRSEVARRMHLMREAGVIDYRFRSQRSIKVLKS